MRSEKEMMDLILSIAREDDRIRAVILNGSRANPNVKPDCFQDYDIVYFVTDISPFCNNPEWIKPFGELMILQMPDMFPEPFPENFEHFTYLMQFMDGNRIDLTFYPTSKIETMHRDSLSVSLLDKDDIFKPFPPANENDYLPLPPTEQQFQHCCNEFWWVSTYVVKGLWRKQILYAKSMLDLIVRPELIKMLTWYIGVQTNFKVNPGSCGKYFQKYLEPSLWDMLLSTYADADYKNTWVAHQQMCLLFRKTALRIAEYYQFEYPHQDDARVSDYLNRYPIPD
ncbi:MAG: aminoglycoside adenylyltransferase [Anaerolineaceae bacterium]|nr:aminoglycoside adenylyltransferase [Anaerolineaceae bacterium]